MIAARLLLLILAFVSFLLAALDVKTSRINLLALGLALWVLAELAPR